jgi:hypothetical protein
LWEIAKSSALSNCNEDYCRLQQKLLEGNHTITEQAVRSWFTGIMGPRDEKQVYQIIDISENMAAITHKKEIRRALGHIRGMRRKVGRRIKHLVKQVAVAEEPMQLLDDAIDLAVEDVLAASRQVVIKQIEILDR